MTARCSSRRQPSPLLFVECNYGRLGVEFQATDRDANSRAEIVRQIRIGAIDPRKILEVTEPCEDFPFGRCVDVTAELCAEAKQHRDPPSLDELQERLRGMLIDRERDLKREGVFGW